MGKQKTFKVSDPKAIQDMNVGDKVEVTWLGNRVKVTKESS